MEFKIDIDFNKIEKYLNEAIDEAIIELAPILEDYARTKHSYKDRSGNLSKNTLAKPLGNKLKVLANTLYADFVIKGTSNITPDKGLEDIIKENEKLINDTLNKHINKALSKLNRR
jgi:hypothetical protein